MKHTWKEYQEFANVLAERIHDVNDRFVTGDFDEVSAALHEAARKYELATAVMEYALSEKLGGYGADELDYIPTAEEIAEIDAEMEN